MDDLKRKYRSLLRENRIVIVWALCTCYDLYYTMNLKSKLVGMDFDYSKASMFSDAMNSIFKAETTVDDFIYDKDNESNEAIRLYKKLNIILDSNLLDKESVLSFLKAMMHKKDSWCWMNSDGYIYMPIYCSILLDYMNGEISKQKIEEKFVYYKLWDGGKPIKGNFALARKTFVQVENMYVDIVTKRISRKMKVENGI